MIEPSESPAQQPEAELQLVVKAVMSSQAVHHCLKPFWTNFALCCWLCLHTETLKEKRVLIRTGIDVGVWNCCLWFLF